MYSLIISLRTYYKYLYLLNLTCSLYSCISLVCRVFMYLIFIFGILEKLMEFTIRVAVKAPLCCFFSCIYSWQIFKMDKTQIQVPLSVLTLMTLFSNIPNGCRATKMVLNFIIKYFTFGNFEDVQKSSYAIDNYKL